MNISISLSVHIILYARPAHQFRNRHNVRRVEFGSFMHSRVPIWYNFHVCIVEQILQPVAIDVIT